MRSLSRPVPAALALAGVAQLLFAFRLGVPSQLFFDEIHYIPAARALLALSHPLNTEHPLLGKELMALGIALFGDGPIGWRFMSTLAATATVIGVFAILWRLFASVRTAVLGSLLLIVNFTLFVQARIAMLDVFMAAFVVLAVAAMLWSARDRPFLWWAAGSASLGLAVAVKWAAAPYVAYAGAAFLILKWRRPDLWPGLGVVRAMTTLGAVSIGVYFLTFAPAFFYAREPLTLATLFPFQLDMYAKQTQILAPHTYQSQWWTWPVPLRAIWYLYEPVDGAQRGVLLVGNPAVMWGGLVSVVLCLSAFVRRRDWRLGGVAALWLGSYLVWAVIPKSLGFFYYYYLPSIWLPVAIAAACHRYARGRFQGADETLAALALGAFFYYYPILSAAPLDRGDAFLRWMLFEGWK